MTDIYVIFNQIFDYGKGAICYYDQFICVMVFSMLTLVCYSYVFIVFRFVR